MGPILTQTVTETKEAISFSKAFLIYSFLLSVPLYIIHTWTWLNIYEQSHVTHICCTLNPTVSLQEIMKCYMERRQDMFYTKDAVSRSIGVDLYKKSGLKKKSQRSFFWTGLTEDHGVPCDGTLVGHCFSVSYLSMMFFYGFSKR